MNEDLIWVEKYRPQTLNELVLDDDTKNIIKNFGKNIPNLLLIGPPGVGKTTISKIIANDILNCDYLYINASDENGVDTIREKVIGFAQTMSFDGGLKIVILDEMDFGTANFQAILRNVMESYTSTTRFILTGNYKHKIIPAIQSRCQSLSLHTSIKDVTHRCLEILKKENIQIPNDQKRHMISLIKNHYPDIRKCINELEKYSKSGILNITSKKDTNILVATVYDNLKGGFAMKTRKYLIDNEELFDSDHELLLKDLLNYIYGLNTCETMKKQLILVIADHLFKMVHVADREICCMACLLQMEEIIQERM